MSAPAAGITGTPTFLFTDIQGSTRLLQQLGDRYAALLDQPRALIGAAVERAGGTVFGTEGDAVFCAFPTAAGAVAAAVEAQRALATHEWPAEGAIRVRMGIHSGEALLASGDYVGLRIGGATESLRAPSGTGLFEAPIEVVDFVMPTRPTDDPAAEREWDIGTRMSAGEAADYAIRDVDADKTELSTG